MNKDERNALNKKRLSYLYDVVKNELSAQNFAFPMLGEYSVIVRRQSDGLTLCGIEVYEDCYRIYEIDDGWAINTDYLVEKQVNQTLFYYVDSVDECVGEILRIIEYLQGIDSLDEREYVLDASFPKRYNYIYDAINETVGTDYTGWMKACWPSPEGNGNFRLWFPKLASTVKGQMIPAANNCLNFLSDDGTEIVYDDLEGRETGSAEDYFKDYDLIFAREPNHGAYIFRGVFKLDLDSSRPNHYISKRIATRVKLIGSPAFKLEIL